MALFAINFTRAPAPLQMKLELDETLAH